jgi:pyruvate,water dikinase
MTSGIIKWLPVLSPTSATEVGAKAANLGRLINFGWSVPDGFCLTTSAYQRFVQTNQLGELLDISRVAGRTAHELIEYCQNAQASILHGEMPEDVASAIRRAYRQLQRNDVSEPVGLAVRSSSTVEDLDSASFSGVFETFLNVLGDDALLLHVKKCWASLWNIAALTWVMKCDLRATPYDMAVVMQRLVKADASGVMFTANPVSGNPFEVIINSSWGLGEGVVSGHIHSDTFVVDEGDLSIKTSHIVDKEMMISTSACFSGGTSMQPVEQAQRSRSSLSEQQVINLARMGLELQRQFGRPQDTEWAIQDGMIYILQARPIVGLPVYFPLSEVDRQGLRYSEWYLEFRELFSPFGRSLERLKNPVYYGARSRALGTQITNYQTTINGYLYHHEVIQKPAYLPSRLLQAWQLLRWFVLARDAERKFREETIPSFTGRMTEIRAAMSKARSLVELLHQLDEAIKRYLAFEAETVLMNVLANAFCTFVIRFCEYLWKESDPHGAAMLFSGLSNKTVQRDIALSRLIGLADEKGLWPCFDGRRSLQEVLQHLENSGLGQDFLGEFGRFRAEFGYVWADGNPKDPGWRENSELVSSVFRNGVHKRPPAAVDAQSLSHTVEARLHSSRLDGLFSLRQKCFRKLVGLAKRYYPYREDHNHYSSSGVMLIRDILYACGEQLVHSGMINDAADVFQLTYEEIIDCPEAIERGTFDTYSALIRKRRVEGERQRRLTPPSTIDLDSSARLATITAPDARHLTGISGSPGVAIGPARVVSRIDLGKVQVGDILICDTFRPEWSPVFRYIRGLVTNRGYKLSHGANLAREWGIPAVMGVHMATHVIGNGDIVEVNGSEGFVRIEPIAYRVPDRQGT